MLPRTKEEFLSLKGQDFTLYHPKCSYISPEGLQNILPYSRLPRFQLEPWHKPHGLVYTLHGGEKPCPECSDLHTCPANNMHIRSLVQSGASLKLNTMLAYVICVMLSCILRH